MGFQQGLSGLNSSAKALDSVGNNIANSGTVGFKSATTAFADVFAASLGGGGQIGIGVQIAAINQQFTQGNITVTNNPLDLAINGQGFYRMNNNGAITWTRNGQFNLDKDGYVVNASGYRLTGYLANANNIIVPSTPSDIFINTADLQPVPTGGSPGATGLEIGLNLDSRRYGASPRPCDSCNRIRRPTTARLRRPFTTRSAILICCRCISERPLRIPGISTRTSMATGAATHELGQRQ